MRKEIKKQLEKLEFKDRECQEHLSFMEEIWETANANKWRAWERASNARFELNRFKIQNKI